MSKLLALGFDAPASPRISFKGPSPFVSSIDPLTGWGIAWYPPDERGAVVVKDPSSHGDDHMSRLLRDWSRFRSSAFICHLRGAARRIAQQDTHPFSRSHASRDWVLTHNGNLADGWREQLPLGPMPAWEPLGKTDTEHILCWLLGRLRDDGIRRLADLGWSKLHAWFQELNELGEANVIVSDGTDLVAYQDRAHFNALHWIRRNPPHEHSVLSNHEIELDLSDVRDRNRTCVLFATSPLCDGWSRMAPGQMLVVRRGAFIWDSAMSAPLGSSKAASDERATWADKVPPGVAPAQVALQQASAVRIPPAASHPEPQEPPVNWQPDPHPVAPNPLPGGRFVAPPGARVLRIVHNTLYRYQTPIERSFHLLRLRPVHNRLQEVLEHKLEVSPLGVQQRYDDVFGNEVVRLDLETSYTELRFSTTSVVRLIPELTRNINASAGRSSIPLVWMPWQRQMMTPYLLPHELPETQLRELFDYAMSFVERQDYDLTETLLDMNATIHRDYTYIQGETTNETTPFEVYSSRRGVCQDFANLLICLARLLGVPARYRAGYIYTGADYENKLQSDATHAWAELYLPWYGWYGFDPTNGCAVNLDHVRVACGRNYRDATPTSGTIFRGGGPEELTIEVRVEVVEGYQGPDPGSP